MKIHDNPYLLKATVGALVATGVSYAVLSPFYEIGAAKYYVPLLGLLMVSAAYGLAKFSPWLQTRIRGLSIGWLLVAMPCWSRSSQFHGEFAMPMLVVESLSILAGLGLLLLSFTPAFRKGR